MSGELVDGQDADQAHAINKLDVMPLAMSGDSVTVEQVAGSCDAGTPHWPMAGLVGLSVVPQLARSVPPRQLNTRLRPA